VTKLRTGTGPCNRELPATREFFHKADDNLIGLQPRCKDCENEYYRARYQQDTIAAAKAMRVYEQGPQGRRIRHLARLRTYGLSEAEYANMLDAHDGLCAICKDPFDEVPYIDHCHKSDRVRGLLCRNCNFGVGFFRDSPELLRAAATYLVMTPQTVSSLGELVNPNA
jgi:hypothetical protein